MKKVCYQLSPFSRTSTGKPVYEPSSNLSEKRKSSRNIQPGHTCSGKLRQIQPNQTCSRKLEYVQPNSTICDSKTKTRHINRKRGGDHLSEVDRVPTNTRSSQGESQLYIFEDNEAVIKIIMKGRSPTMRHVSRTHRVALDRLF